jgi:hypothetical protein
MLAAIWMITSTMRKVITSRRSGTLRAKCGMLWSLKLWNTLRGYLAQKCHFLGLRRADFPLPITWLDDHRELIPVQLLSEAIYVGEARVSGKVTLR